MKKYLKLIAFMLTVLLIFSFVGCGRSKENNNNSDNTQVDKESNDVALDIYNRTQAEAKTGTSVDFTLSEKIVQSERSNTEYSVMAPKWTEIEDFFYESDYYGRIRLYNRLYQCPENGNLYFFVSEYLGFDRAPTGQKFVAYRDACDAMADWCLDKCFTYYFNKGRKINEGGWYCSESIVENAKNRPESDWAAKYVKTVVGEELKDNKDGCAYVKGSTFYCGDTIVSFMFLDTTKEQVYADILDGVVDSQIDSVKFGKLIIHVPETYIDE